MTVQQIIQFTCCLVKCVESILEQVIDNACGSFKKVIHYTCCPLENIVHDISYITDRVAASAILSVLAIVPVTAIATIIPILAIRSVCTIVIDNRIMIDGMIGNVCYVRCIISIAVSIVGLIIFCGIFKCSKVNGRRRE